jgi:hypothetical protein
MRGLGYIEGKNLAIERRSAEGKFERLPEIIGELVALNVDVIVSAADVVIQKAMTVTSTTPIVMAGVAVPAERGFVQSPRTARCERNRPIERGYMSPLRLSAAADTLLIQLVGSLSRLDGAHQVPQRRPG